MPYKYADAWHVRQRAFIAKKMKLGKLYQDAAEQYDIWLTQAWELMGCPDPKEVTLEQMELLEAIWPISENTKANRLRVVRKFLQVCGNKDAVKWEILAVAHPKTDRQFFSEDAVAELRSVAHRMGPKHELVFSLGVDNSLRRGDIARITLDEAMELLWKGQAVITCKGRKGGKRRLMVMHQDTRQPLREYLQGPRAELVRRYGYDPGGLILGVFLGRLKNLSADGVGEITKRIGVKAKLELHSHDLRATFGNRHWKQGTDMAIIALLMGHETPDQTFKAYIGVSQADMRKAQDSLGHPKASP